MYFNHVRTSKQTHTNIHTPTRRRCSARQRATPIRIHHPHHLPKLSALKQNRLAEHHQASRCAQKSTGSPPLQVPATPCCACGDAARSANSGSLACSSMLAQPHARRAAEQRATGNGAKRRWRWWERKRRNRRAWPPGSGRRHEKYTEISAWPPFATG